MRTLHFDCFSGISGDMTVAALADAGADRTAILSAIGSLGLPVSCEFQAVKKNGLAATYFRVVAEPEHKHRHLSHIEKIIAAGQLTENQRQLACRIFRQLAAAEAKVHGTSIEKVHFHEVGAADSIVDIVAAAVAIDSLQVEFITARSVPTGHGTIQCEHGLMPIPAPATAELLLGAPLAASPVEAELTTPTGAAILKTIVNEWTDSPALTISQIGVGTGTKDFAEQPNVLRVFVGKIENNVSTDRVWVLETNLDDVSGEVIGFCTERLFHAGALDVYSIPLQMKKGRPGVMLGVIAPLELVAGMEEILFRQTGTLGIRKHSVSRSKLERALVEVDTPWGKVRAKKSWRADGHATLSPEYEDCAAIARKHDIALSAVYDEIKKHHFKQ